MSKILNRLCKWRAVFCGWQLGTRATQDPEAQALRDHRELGLLLRVEVSALVSLLVQKKVFSTVEFSAQCDVEAESLMDRLEELFPGFRSTDDGMVMTMPEAKNTTRNWPP